MRTTIAAAIILSLIGVFSATAQQKAPDPMTTAVLDPAVSLPAIAIPSSLIGQWKGTWEGGGRSQVHGQMEVELQASDGDHMTGRMRATYVFSTDPCSKDWENLKAVKTAEKVLVQYNLGGRCGNVVLDLTIKDNLLLGTYVSEAGFGAIRLKKQ